MKTRLPGLLAAALLIAGGLVTAAAADDQADLIASFNKPGDVDSKVADGLITGSRIDLIVSALEKGGFEVEVTKAKDGQPQIASTDENHPFTIHFYGCTKEGFDCGYIQFVNGWNMDNGVTAVKIEQWNNNQVWGQAYRDDSKDPWIGMTVNLRGGVTQENFADTIEWWAKILDDFQEHIGWNDN